MRIPVSPVHTSLFTGELREPHVHHSRPAGRKSAHRSGAHHERMDPVERTQKRLDELNQKLNLKSEQQSAWKTYSAAALARADERAKHMQEHRARGGDNHADMDTATRLEHMSQRMRKRADKVQEMARDTRAIQQALSAEQKTIFDLYWKSQFGHGKMRRRN